jgi:predicted XRE-type DNA-binding protein
MLPRSAFGFEEMNEEFENVWDAIEDTRADAGNMKLRSDLMVLLAEHLRESGLSQAEAALVFGVTPPRISDLVCGKINLSSIDSLTKFDDVCAIHVWDRTRMIGSVAG